MQNIYVPAQAASMANDPSRPQQEGAMKAAKEAALIGNWHLLIVTLFSLLSWEGIQGNTGRITGKDLDLSFWLMLERTLIFLFG